MALVEHEGVLGKICTKCKEWKPLERFSPRKAMRDGYQSQCKPCNNAPNTTRQPVQIEGKTCSKCGEWKPISEYNLKQYSYDGHRSACRICLQIQIKAHRETDIEASRRRERERHHANRIHRIMKRRSRITARLNEHQAYMRSWRSHNRDKMKIYGKVNYEKNRDRIREKSKQYYRMHPEKRQAITARRRTRLANAEGSFTPQEWREVKERYNFTCLACHRQEPQIKLTPDHVVPLAKHGNNYITNIQPLCRSCNSAKRDKTIDYRPAWEAEHGGE